jgi:hypothetical protein
MPVTARGTRQRAYAEAEAWIAANQGAGDV